MWTPPPITEIDEVRVNAGAYTEAEVMMAWYMQTSEGQPWNVRLFFNQYQSMAEYLERNSAADVANQIDWWTGTRIYNHKESLSERHIGDLDCFDRQREEHYRDAERDEQEFGSGWEYLGVTAGGEPPDPEDEYFAGCEVEEFAGRHECAYSPTAEEVADDMMEHDYIWDESIQQHDDLREGLEVLRAWTGYDNLMERLNHYATNRRSLSEDLERRKAA